MCVVAACKTISLIDRAICPSSEILMSATYTHGVNCFNCECCLMMQLRLLCGRFLHLPEVDCKMILHEMYVICYYYGKLDGQG